MGPKKIVKNIVTSTFDYRLRKRNVPEVERQIKYLKGKDLFKPYPLKEHPPTVANYPFYNGKTDVKWLDYFYSVYGKADKDLMPVPVYFHIEDCLNDRMLTYSLKEKNFYDNFIGEIKTPHTVLRKINGFLYDYDFKRVTAVQPLLDAWKKNYRYLFLKPSIDSGGGSSIMKFELDGDKFVGDGKAMGDDFFTSYKHDFVLQEYVKQHKFYSQFNPDSNNTLRFFIYRSVTDDQIHILHTILRIGAKGSFLDHDHLGGVAVAIDDKNRVSEHAIDIHGVKHDTVNGIKLSELPEAPFVTEAREVATRIAERVYYGRLLALDFTVSNKGEPLFIELNCRRNGINQYQMHNGPLFREHTSAVLEHCLNIKPKVIISI